MKLSLLVLENPWYESLADSLSVVPFVEGFTRWAPDVSMYVRPFYRAAEFQTWLSDFARKRRGIGRRVVYVASHGTTGRVGGLPDGSGAFNFGTLLAILKQTTALDGIHLGCCSFGNRRNAERLLRPDRRRRRAVPLHWVAGYNRDIDWLDSMLVDLAFWKFLLTDPAHDAWRAVERTYRYLPDSRKMGFAVFKNGPGGRLLDSLTSAKK